MTNERVGYEYLISGEGSNSWSYSKSAESKGASDRQNQQSSSLSFQDLNLLYNNQWSTQINYLLVPYLFYDQNITSLANDTPINGFIEPSCSDEHNHPMTPSPTTTIAKYCKFNSEMIQFIEFC
ncbi:20025_t:CDS:2, partial [Gigaspora rosea]